MSSSIRECEGTRPVKQGRNANNQAREHTNTSTQTSSTSNTQMSQRTKTQQTIGLNEHDLEPLASTQVKEQPNKRTDK